MIRYWLWRAFDNDFPRGRRGVETWWAPDVNRARRLMVGFRCWGKLRGVHPSRYW
jgi:hypothetical protein